MNITTISVPAHPPRPRYVFAPFRGHGLGGFLRVRDVFAVLQLGGAGCDLAERGMLVTLFAPDFDAHVDLHGRGRPQRVPVSAAKIRR